VCSLMNLPATELFELIADYFEVYGSTRER
jgi:hypothetical protein